MARFYGSNLDKKPHLNRTVLAWLEKLPDEFDVFVELEGSDFQIDFLVIKRYGLFNVEAKDWRVREARLDADWILASGDTREDPFLQVLDQCAKVHNYILYQRGEIFSPEEARVVDQFRNELKVFPVVAISQAYGSMSIFTHAYRKVFADDIKLRKHLNFYEWFHQSDQLFSFEKNHVERLAALFHLRRFDPRTITPLSSAKPEQQAPRGRISRPAATQLSVDLKNPYQYTYTVTGHDFYGREGELQRIRRALEAVPSPPVVIMGLQRTGKSSLALESVRRLTAGTTPYSKVSYDFRGLSTEGVRPEQDITFELLDELAGDNANPDLQRIVGDFRQKAVKASLPEQRRFFHEALKRNRDQGRHTILFLDECQEVAYFLNEERHQSFFAFVDALCREKELNLHVILACRSSFFDLDPIRKINFGRLCEIITLGPLDDAASKAIIDRGSALLRFAPAAIQRITFLTGKHPFWVQFLCHKLFENAVLKRTNEVTENDVNVVFDFIVKDPGCKPQFYLLYQEIETNPQAMSLLKSISDVATKEGSTIELTALAKDWADQNKLRSALKPLIDNQILSLEKVPENPTVRFQVEALRAWMRPNLITL